MRKALERMGCEIETFYKGVGCRNCRNTGFRGRMGIHELLIVNEEMRDAILTGVSITAIREIAIRGGMLTLRRDGFRKVREGITTAEEVLHATGGAPEPGSVRPEPVAAPTIAPVVVPGPIPSPAPSAAE
jgi:type IV pilus assembly protein PilB